MSLIMRYLKTRRNFAGENNDIGKVCLCPTNSVFADKEPCPQRGRELLQSRTYNKERQ